jgi:pimeloyl-ACP methyl ester carboxylesterase
VPARTVVRISSQREDHMNTVTSRDGTTIAFDRSGHGPAVILVAGAFGDRSMMAPLAALLAPRFTVYAYDRRGRGGSGDTAPYAVEREIDDIEAMVEHAGGSAYAYGISSGAVLALRAALALPGITKLALYEPPFIVDDGHPPVPADYVDRVKELTATGRPGDAVELFLTFVGVPAEEVAQMRAEPFWAALEAMAHTLAYDFTVMAGTQSGAPLPAKWASLSTPTLVADGEKTPQQYIRPAADALGALLPHARRHTVAGQDHAVAPDAIAPVLTGYFTDQL